MFYERIEAIKKMLKKEGQDVYLVFSNDYHGSEYVVDYFKVRAFLSGFTGSAGTLIVTQNESFLLTDGRYYLQAERQLKEAKINLLKSTAMPKGKSQLVEFLKEKKLFKVRFDYKIASSAFKKLLDKAKCFHVFDDNPSFINDIWNDRPALPESKVYRIPDRYVGDTLAQKLSFIRDDLSKNHAEYTLISSLDDIAYILNLRGNDILHSPVFLSYLLIGKNDAILYINPHKLTASIRKYLKANGFSIRKYDAVYNDVKHIKDPILFNEKLVNLSLASSIQNKIITDLLISSKMKSIKQEVEIKQIRKAHIKDAIAMIKFMKHIKCDKLDNESEVSLGNYLDNLRYEQGAIDISFDSIIGYNDHGAIIHYSATPETDYKVKNEGVLLVDSGGQYKYGTTDTTRTFVLGKVSKEFVHDSTLVLKAHIALSTARFKAGKTDTKLDKITRAPMKKEGKDYLHGTGHGIGYCLNVHEGPQSINSRKYNPVVMQEGMVTSCEPGYYLEGKYGIRHENEILTRASKSGRLYFETLTYVPYDIDGIDVSMLSVKEIKYINKYHAMIRRKLARYLDADTLKFLIHVTREIK